MSADLPLVSILIPVYQREIYIEEAINSALQQTYKNIEIIIVDNASTDATWSICSKYAIKYDNIKAFQNENNIGPVNNWKKCLDYANGYFAKILWSDDLMHPEFVEQALSLFTDDIGLVYSSVIIGEEFSSNNNVHYRYGKTGKYSSKQFITDLIYNSNTPVSPGCAIFRLQDLKNNLGVKISSPAFNDFDEHGAGPDLLLFLLTAKAYEKIAFIDNPLIFFREHKNSISIAMKKLDLFDRYQQARIWFADKYLSTEIREKLLNKTWQDRIIITKNIIPKKSIIKIYGVNTKLSYIKLCFGLIGYITKKIINKFFRILKP